MESMGLNFRGSTTSADPSFRGSATRVGPKDACSGLRWHPDRRLFRDGEGVACFVGHVTLSPSFLAFLLSCCFCLLMMLKGVRACRCCADSWYVSLVCVCVSVSARACVLLCFVFRLSPSGFPRSIPSTIVSCCARIHRRCCLHADC